MSKKPMPVLTVTSSISFYLKYFLQFMKNHYKTVFVHQNKHMKAIYTLQCWNECKAIFTWMVRAKKTNLLWGGPSWLGTCSEYFSVLLIFKIIKDVTQFKQNRKNCNSPLCRLSVECLDLLIFWYSDILRYIAIALYYNVTTFGTCRIITGYI